MILRNAHVGNIGLSYFRIVILVFGGIETAIVSAVFNAVAMNDD